MLYSDGTGFRDWEGWVAFGSAKQRLRVASYGITNDRTLYFLTDYLMSLSLSGSGVSSSEHVFCGSESCKLALILLNLDS
jgi:hypothetical protein